MAQPFNYQLNLPDPTQSVLGGVQAGMGIANLMSQRNLAEQQAIDAQAAREKKAQLDADLDEISQNPTTRGLASLMVKHPSLSEQFKRTYDVLSAEQKNARVSQASNVYAAMQSGRPDFAKAMIEEQIIAARNAGREDEAKAAETMSKLIDLNPEGAKTSAGLFLASAIGPDKFAETFGKLGAEGREEAMAPGKMREQVAKAGEAESSAQKAAVAAKFAESNAAIDLQKKGWDITKIQEDIKIAKQNSQIAAMNSQIAREGNAIKREENQLKLREMIDKRDTAVREKVAEVENARSAMDNMLNTADRIIATPFSVVGSAAGPISARAPTLFQDTADFEALVETLGSQAFLAQIPNIKGMGALSNAEGDKLQAALQNFSLKQSPERLLENVKEAQRLILKGRATLAKRAGLPESIPDTPAVQTSPGDIDALVKKYGG
jgi:uncharacterized coiled-coil protein SlyX